MKATIKQLSITTLLATSLLMPFTQSANAADSGAAASMPVTADRQSPRLQPLEGGSNFRDLGGYQTANGKTVIRGKLFRSGVMTGLTRKDETFLTQYDFAAVVDLRSSEELALYPNHWVEHDKHLRYRHHDYSLIQNMAKAVKTTGEDAKPEFQPEVFYRAMPEGFAPQIKMYFEEALKGDGAVVVNCSAGQDRTGFASALMLSTLGVPRKVIIEDYLLSTAYRRPSVERGDVDLESAAKTNSFAKMMLRYKEEGKTAKPQPLLTEDGTPYIQFALQQIEQDYGSVDDYLKKALGLKDADLNRLKQLYLM